MSPEPLPHASLEHRDMSFRVQPAPVNDADAARVRALVVDEPLQARDGSRRGHPVQVEPPAGGVFSTFQPSKLASIHTVGDKPSL